MRLRVESSPLTEESASATAPTQGPVLCWPLTVLRVTSACGSNTS